MTSRRGWGPLPLLLLLFLLFLAAFPVRADHFVRAGQGVLALAHAPTQPVPLNGEWGFAWQRFVDPAWQQLPTQAFAPVPESWNDVTADGKTPGENGWGSYVLRLDCPAGQSLALDAFGQRTAGRLYVNGTLVAQHGTPGAGAAATWAAVHNRVPLTREFACPLRITLHVANFDHRAGGFVRPILAGPLPVLERAREARLIQASGLLASYLIIGTVALIFFVVRHREPLPLTFGLFCVAIALYTDLIGERLFLRLLPPQVDWAAYMRAEYLSWIAAMALFFVTLRDLFPARIDRRVGYAVLGALAAAAVAVLALPPSIYSYVVLPGQAIAVAVALYVAVAMLRTQGPQRFDARVLLAGMVAVLAALAIDLLLIDAPGPDRKFLPVGFALFMLSPAVVIARRLSAALNAEERSRTLEENARLREDVERISRHDLKTPLNSILGAARLLHEDGRLSGDQRELMGVLQRAGLRMLEMVNLSLGLFRMETGSYALRPEAVDLRELVSRVLVDLHPYAEANRVVLHWVRSAPAPALVRGEELLCYSILANLVKNAIEAAGPGHEVTVDLRDGDPVRVSVHNPGEVPPEIASRFFEKYVSAGKSGGTGLGTYSARMMARAQNGDLALATGAQGTTVTLTLPALKEALDAPAPQEPSGAPPAAWLHALPQRDVLLADDDEFNRLVTRRMLPSPPFSVRTAANGQAAVEAMTQQWPDYLLVDMEMPLRSGVETVEWVRALEAAQDRPRCRIVMLSGNDDDASMARALEAGADRYLVKPVRRERLLAALRELEPEVPASAPVPMPAQEPPSRPPDTVVVEEQWRDHFEAFMALQRKTGDEMAVALQAGDRDRLQFLGHRAFGGLAALEMDWAARQCRRIEASAATAPLEELRTLVEALRQHLAQVRPQFR